MHWRGTVAGLLVVIVTTGAAADLTIATYNVENYVATNRLIPDGYRKDYPKTEEAKAALRRVIRNLHADVLVLEEMGPRPYLDELQRDLRQDGVAYPEAILLEADDPDRHVAILSRREFKAVVPHTDLQFSYFDGVEKIKRGLLEVVIATAGGEVTLWALHLKSRYTSRPDDPGSARRRAGEAMAIREFILRQCGDPQAARYLVLGDFNDVKNSAAVRYLTQKGDRTTAHLLPAGDSRNEAWTYYYRKEDTYSRVDHVLVSPGLLPFVRSRRARIYDGEGVMVASDHRPVVIALLDEPDQSSDEQAE